MHVVQESGEVVTASFPRVTVKVGRVLSFSARASDGGYTEAIVVACEIGSEASVDRVNAAATAVSERAAQVLAEIPESRLYGTPRLRGGWAPAVVQEVIAPMGEGAKRGYKAQKSKL